MNTWEEHLPLLTMLLGLSIVFSVLSKWALQRLQLPAAIGWLGIGIALRAIDPEQLIVTAPMRSPGPHVLR